MMCDPTKNHYASVMERAFLPPAVRCCLGLVLGLACSSAAEQTLAMPGLITLADETIQARIAPWLGGRLVDLRLNGRSSVLDVEQDNVLSSQGIDHIAEHRGFEWFYRSYRGHSVWVGPQKAFWTDQDYVPGHVGRSWPPDPFHSFGPCEIIERSESRVVLRGPVSKVNGLRLTKTYELLGHGRLRSLVRIDNCGDRVQERDCWPLTRVPVSASTYVAAAAVENIRIEHTATNKPDAESPRLVAYEIEDGFFRMTPVEPTAGIRQAAKYFLDIPRERAGMPVGIACFTGDTQLRITADGVADEHLHESHSFIELYLSLDGAGEGIQELEMHSPLIRLAPGEGSDFEQIIELTPYDGAATIEAHRDHLQRQ